MNQNQFDLKKIGVDFVKRILFVDDCEDTNFLHNEYVKMVDDSLKVTSIQQSTKVINYLSEAYERNVFPDLIFMDINLPLVDGFELLETYKENKFFLKCPETKIFMLSSVEHHKDKKRLEGFPFVSGHLIKPLNDDVLVKIISGTD